MLDAAVSECLPSRQQVTGPPSFSAPTPSGSRPWACCHTHPQAERWAHLNLTRQGFDAYLPLVTVSRRDRVIRSLVHRVEVPLFPRYLFVRIQSNWAPIAHTRGIHYLLMNAGHPNTVAEAAVDALRAACANPAPEHQWAAGTPCTPLLGPMRGLPAVVLSLDHDTARIGLMFLGQLRQISLNVDCLTVREE